MRSIITIFLFSIGFLSGCTSSQNLPAADTATLSIFYSNDMMGYLEPCG